MDQEPEVSGRWSLRRLSQLRRSVLGSQLRRNLLTSAASTALNTAIALATYPLYLGYLGLERYGIWLALSVLLSLIQIGAVGVGPAVAKFVAESWSTADVDGVVRTVSNSSALIVLVGGAVAGSMILGRDGIVATFDLDEGAATTAHSLLPQVALLSVYAIFIQAIQAILSGLGRADRTAASLTLGRTVTLLTSWLLLRAGWALESLVIGAFVGQAVSHTLCIFWIRRLVLVPVFRFDRISQPELLRLLRFGGGLAGSSMMQALLHPLNRVLISRYGGGVSALPIFEIAWGGAMQVRALLASALEAMLADFSRAAARSDLGRSRQLLRGAYALVGAVGLPLFAGLALLAPLALTLWLRESFHPEMLIPFRIMLLTAFISLIGVPGFFHLLGAGQVRHVFVSQVLQTVINATTALGLAACHALNPTSMCVCAALGCTSATTYLLARSRKLVEHPS